MNPLEIRKGLSVFGKWAQISNNTHVYYDIRWYINVKNALKNYKNCTIFEKIFEKKITSQIIFNYFPHPSFFE